MTATEAWARARRQLERANGDAALGGEVLFVDDDRVEYDLPQRIRVNRSDLFDLEDATSWEPFLVPPPTWLHFNLLRVGPDAGVVTLRRSRDAVPPAEERESAINVSSERVSAELVNA